MALRFKTATALFCTVMFFGCSSAEKKARELMENGSYEEAERAYARIVEEDAKNAEAQAGLLSARHKVLDTRLIEVRKARSGGNPKDAANLLLDILTLEKKWNVRPPGAAVFTQQEETGFAANALLGSLKSGLAENFPLKQEVEFRRYEPLFQEMRQKEFNGLREENRKAGAGQCAKFSKELRPATPYLSEFMQKFCVFWGEKSDEIVVDEGVMNRPLIREARVSGNFTGFTGQVQSELSALAQKSLQETPWYSASGKVSAELAGAGNWVRDEQKTAISMVHTYSEPETYVVHEQVKKTRQVPYEAVENERDPRTGALVPVTRVRYRNEDYYETEPVEKTRYVQKHFPYGGWKISQNLKIDLDAATQVSAHPIKVAVHEQNHSEDTASEVSVPGIGLKPKAPTLIPDQAGWLKTREQEFARQLSTQLSALWSDLYCSDAPVNGFATSGNRARQCLRLASASKTAPRFVDDWHLKYFGLNTRAVQELVWSPSSR